MNNLSSKKVNLKIANPAIKNTQLGVNHIYYFIIHHYFLFVQIKKVFSARFRIDSLDLLIF
jgi:hypothetical protein